jgi:hypothetical protein
MTKLLWGNERIRQPKVYAQSAFEGLISEGNFFYYFSINLILLEIFTYFIKQIRVLIMYFSRDYIHSSFVRSS